jgi:hypothetical protein
MARPTIPEEKKMKKRCEVLFTEKEWDWLNFSADAEGFSAPQFIRLLCRKWYFEQHGEKLPKERFERI